MPLPRLALSVIGDEIGPSLDEMISFAHEHGLKRLDMRTVDGRNLLGMKKEEVIAISRKLEKAGLTVPAFVSPMFKWQAPGKSTAGGKVDFAFDPDSCPAENIADHAMEVAVILGAPHMRIFSYLRYPGFRPADFGRLSKDVGKLHSLAHHFDITLQVENEPVCNIGSIAELANFFATVPWLPMGGDEEIEEIEAEDIREPPQRYVRPLVDIANAWSLGVPPSDSDIATLAPLTTAIHLKDRNLEARRTVPLGDGDVPWPAELERLLSGVKAPEVLASIETHCPQNGREATARSIEGLRRIARDVGVEIV
ncbi:MAG: sugar phosphate isomerase/epimerase family protein [Reyranella sp.]|uniref:sugar phosphate isomerase/epimerase family protein n=1 Tax=Reyranella sp. TaxID=1929291 RepID=UPI003D0FEE88